MIVLRVSKRKKTKMFRCVASFFHVIDEMFINFCTPPCSEIFLVAHLYSGIILSAKRSILTVWQGCEYVCLGNCSVICTVTSCYVLHQTYSEFWHIQHCFFRYILAYSIVFNAIKGIFTHIETLFKAHSGLFRHIQHPALTLTYSKLCQILSPGIFRTRALFKTLWNIDKTYSEPCHKALFSHIQAYSEPCTTLAYAETWHTQNPGIFRTLP